MKKGKSILSLILVIAVTALFGMTCVLGLDLKGMGAAKNINLGLDLEGGVSITYQVKVTSHLRQTWMTPCTSFRNVWSSTAQRHRLIRLETTVSVSRFRV